MPNMTMQVQQTVMVTEREDGVPVVTPTQLIPLRLDSTKRSALEAINILQSDGWELFQFQISPLTVVLVRSVSRDGMRAAVFDE